MQIEVATMQTDNEWYLVRAWGEWALRLREHKAYYWDKKPCGVQRNGVAQSGHTTEWLT
jgi:hypothetical protein